MSGYLNSDGSQLVGALNPAGSGQALQVDAQGNLKTTATLNGVAPQADGSGANRLGVSLYGKNTTAGDTPILLDSAGRLQVNVAQWNGASPSVSNPLSVRQQLAEWLSNGQGFSATTGKQTSTASATTGLSLFNPPSSSKTLIVFSARVAEAASSWHQMNLTSSDPALGSTLSAVNLKAGGPPSVASLSMSNTNVTPAGTQIDTLLLVSNSTIEWLNNGALIILPPSNGLALYVSTTTNSWAAMLKWVEL